MAAALGGGCACLWALVNVGLVTSEFAAKEAWGNLDDKPDSRAARGRLVGLLARMELVPYKEPTLPLFSAWTLRDPDDIPILLGAIESGCDYLLTADVRHFGEYMGRTLDGVTILKPGIFRAMHNVNKTPRAGAD